MRDILFKAKTTPKGTGEFNEVWGQGDLVTSNGKYYIHPKANTVSVINELGRLLVMHEVQPDTICQFTGLTDKNGSKIWENDIVADKRYKYRVVWDEEEGSWMLEETASTARYGLAGIGRINSDKFEVVGNVFDNADLVKE